jgi:hypothetical protein
LQIHFGVEASTVMQWTVNPPRLRTPGSIPGYSTKIPASPVVIHRACTNSTIKLGVHTIYLRVPMEGAWRNRRVLLISPIENNQTDSVENSSRGVGDDLAYTILKYITKSPGSERGIVYFNMVRIDK